MLLLLSPWLTRNFNLYLFPDFIQSSIQEFRYARSVSIIRPRRDRCNFGVGLGVNEVYRKNQLIVVVVDSDIRKLDIEVIPRCVLVPVALGRGNFTTRQILQLASLLKERIQAEMVNKR